MAIRVQTEDFDVGQEVNRIRLAQPQAGAVVAFVGQVRDLNDGSAVSAMMLEHYPGMTEKSLQAIENQAKSRWQIADSLIVHRVGILQPLDQIVLVITASAHRGDAFAACGFMMDYLKTQAPFWKKEETSEGARWVESKVADEQAVEKWKI